MFDGVLAAVALPGMLAVVLTIIAAIIRARWLLLAGVAAVFQDFGNHEVAAPTFAAAAR